MRHDTSHFVDLDGPTHYLDFGGPDGPGSAPPVVFVHGLGGSHVNWVVVGPRLARDQRAYAIDLAGHGLTAPDHRGTDVRSNQRLLDRFLREVVGRPAVLVGNSMGGMVSILQASAHTESVAALVLVDPAVPAPLTVPPDPSVALSFAGYAVPGLAPAMLARRRVQRTVEEQVHEILSLCCVDPERVPVEAVNRAIELGYARRGFEHLDRAFLDAARSVILTLTLRRQYVARMHAVQAPVLLLHGDRDRLVPVAAARLAARELPAWRVEIAADIGHVPQLEAPDWTVDRYRAWWHGLSLSQAG